MTLPAGGCTSRRLWLAAAGAVAAIGAGALAPAAARAAAPSVLPRNRAVPGGGACTNRRAVANAACSAGSGSVMDVGQNEVTPFFAR